MTTNTEPLERAAELLRHYAHELQQSHTSHRAPDDWTGEDEAKAAHDEHLALADALESEHARVQELTAEAERQNARIARMGVDVDRALCGDVSDSSPLGAGRLRAVAAMHERIVELEACLFAECVADGRELVRVRARGAKGESK